MADAMAKAADVTVRISRQETLLIMYDHGEKDLAHTAANSPCTARIQGTVGIRGEEGGWLGNRTCFLEECSSLDIRAS